ncbi:MAG: ParB/RepB/Spo0J family partition protein, partial [Desulfobacterales bacterium]|nr:ParB/RepB/Spo0J family partition protein [Desulfobacterales bacterium]
MPDQVRHDDFGTFYEFINVGCSSFKTTRCGINATSNENLMRFKIKTVPVSCIDLEDNTYRITTKTKIDALINSINKVGLINPPLLIAKGSTFTVICGFCRIEACRYLGLAAIEAKILDSDTSRLRCAKIAIADNTMQRQLNLIEKSKALSLLSIFYKDSISLSKAALELGLPENPDLIKKIKNISCLPSSVQDRILSNTIPLSIAVELGMLEQDAAVLLATLFHEFKLSLNKQKEIITLIKEIAFLENISIMEALNKCDFPDILNREDIDRTQKTQRIRACLKQRRFPEITKAEREFENNVKELKLGSGIKLIQPAYFEGQTYMLNLRFNTIKELQERVVKLNSIVKNPILEKIL